MCSPPASAATTTTTTATKPTQPPLLRRLITASAVTVIAVPALSYVLNRIWSTPPADYGSGSMFDLIAARYDLVNRALALNMDTGWRRVMVEEVYARHGGGGGGGDVGGEGDGGGEGGGGEWGDDGSALKILDLATGTADVAILLAESSLRLSIPASVLGVDPSPKMIEVGTRKVSDRSLSHVVTLKIGDARDLSGSGDGTYDAATVSFGIRNVPERGRALCEIYRVLKKPTSENSVEGGESRGGVGGGGGTLAVLEFSEPSPNSGIMGALARLFIRHVVPLLGAALSGAPREYMHLQNSIGEFPSPEEFREEMEGVRCGGGAGEGEGEGTFHVEEIRHMNFGSVQLYLAGPVLL